jgi:hypothetical protein
MTEGIQMHGIIADENQTSQEVGLGPKTRFDSSRKPYLRFVPDPRGTAEVIPAFDRPKPRHKPDELLNASGPASRGPAVQQDDEHRFVCSGQNGDVGAYSNSIQADLVLSRHGQLAGCLLCARSGRSIRIRNGSLQPPR